MSHDSNTRARLATSAVFFLSGINVATWVSRIPAIKDKLGIGEAELGVALLCSAIGSMLTMPLWGALTARIGSRAASRISSFVAFAAVPLLALAPSLAWLMATLALFGATAGGLNVTMNAQAVAVETAYGRPILSSLHAMFSLGGMTGAAVGGLLAGRGVGVDRHFVGCAMLLVLASAVACRFLLPPAADRKADSSGGGGGGFAMPHGPLLALGALAGCIMSGEGAMADWVALYLRDTVHTTEAVAALGYAVFSAGMVGGRLLGDAATARYGAALLARNCCALAALGTFLALSFHLPATALIGFFLTGAGYSVIVPLVYAAAGRLPGVNAGVAIATVSVTGFVGFLSGPPVIGFLAKATSLRAALFVLVLLSAIAVPLSRFLNVASDEKRG